MILDVYLRYSILLEQNLCELPRREKLGAQKVTEEQFWAQAEHFDSESSLALNAEGLQLEKLQHQLIWSILEI